MPDFWVAFGRHTAHSSPVRVTPAQISENGTAFIENSI
jgi:hypothetical protein